MDERTDAARATRGDVARLAGVSTAVVSYVVNGGPRPVADDTRARVLAAVRALDYRPNASARALKRGSTQLLGLVVSEIVNPYFSEFIDAIDAAAFEHSHSIILTSTHERAERERLLVPALIERGIDGLIFLTRLHDHGLYSIAEATIPRVFLDHSYPTLPHHTISPDALDGAHRATNHLIEHGHTRLGIILGVHESPQIDLRRVGWERALAAAGIADPGPTITTWDRRGGYDGARLLLDSAEPPTAILAGSDLIAVGALQAIRDHGLRVPDDIAIVSYDGTSESEYSSPPLTAVRQPFEAMAAAAVERVIFRQSTPDHLVFPMEFVVRRSCGCAP
ncbi:LacI family DNA-binding transcriptional regulator [Microbacterium sp. 18062]|uniref:LacI family DNA-binding transcriptional regulator n=1 Tax=Microbacterium sp. 18062 TaxID=2681410 RepID=UPI00190F29D3|nr:LacI family DNA-binding transcriptional regulator [Microbacterium sp. 18062]